MTEEVPSDLLALLQRKLQVVLECGCVVSVDMPETWADIKAEKERLRKEHRCEKS